MTILIGGSVPALLGLGSNLGDREANLRGAVRSLQQTSGIDLLAVSQLIETQPVGMQSPDQFLNAAASVATILSARSLLDRCLAIEARYGRQRDPVARWQPRTLDIDLLLFGEEILDEPSLRVPHPHFHERLFALIPAAEIAGHMRHPILGKSVADLLQDLQTAAAARPDE